MNSMLKASEYADRLRLISIDSRVEWIKRSTPHIERRLGSPMAISVPKFAKSWTIRKFDEDKAGGVP